MEFYLHYLYSFSRIFSIKTYPVHQNYTKGILVFPKEIEKFKSFLCILLFNWPKELFILYFIDK